LKEELGDKKDALERLSKEYERLRLSSDGLKEELDRTRVELGVLRTEIGEKPGLVSREGLKRLMKDELAVIRSDRDKVLHQRDSYWKDIERLTQEVAALRFQLKEVRNLEAENLSLRGKVHMLEGVNADLRSQLKCRGRSAEDIKKQVEDTMREGLKGFVGAPPDKRVGEHQQFKKLARIEDVNKLRSEFDVNLANLAKRVNKFDEHIQEVAKGLIDRFDSALAERVTASEVTRGLDSLERRLREYIESRIEMRFDKHCRFTHVGPSEHNSDPHLYAKRMKPVVDINPKHGRMVKTKLPDVGKGYTDEQLEVATKSILDSEDERIAEALEKCASKPCPCPNCKGARAQHKKLLKKKTGKKR
jgi:hypothetical protein